jgi:membrane protein DedA with SNARE-associated domain
MLETWLTFQAWLQNSLHTSDSQVLVFLSLVFTTFLLEDVAIAAGATLAVNGVIAWEFAFTAVAGGIALGDLGLYWVGQQCHRIKWLRRRYIDQKAILIKQNLEARLASIIFIARIIPGLRLLTYVSCGYCHIRFLPFALWVVTSVAIWTAGILWIGSAFGEKLSNVLGIPITLATPLLILLIAIAIPLFRKVKTNE